ncbi:MAG: SpoIIE family protein phosphatase [Bacteroidales bacterium]|nr:SpoIIE family protein phosphatase [Bacteroidales bacterium]
MRRSISARLSFWIVLATALLFLGMILYLASVWRSGVRKEVDKDARQVLESAVFHLDDILDDAKRTADVLSWFVMRDIDKPDMMVSHSNNTLRYDPNLNSCSISFEPWFYPGKGEFYSIFSWRKDGEIVWEQEGDSEYRYFDKVWYRQARESGVDSWTDAYSDVVEGDDPSMNTGMLVSFCKPFYRDTGIFAGSISLDLSLMSLSAELYDVKPYENAYCILIGRDGSYLVHPDSGKLYSHSIFTDAEDMSLPELGELGTAMVAQESGEREIVMDGQVYFAFFEPITATGWSMAIFCPESDIYGGFDRLQRRMAISLFLSLLMMFFLFVLLIRRQLAPLGKLAEEAEFIASGNFDRSLPSAPSNDEIGMLSQSFQHMQSSLVQHIKQLTDSTASRERMERELQIARNIQMSMVPHDFNLGDSVDLYASMIPARAVGGDLYDFFVQDGKLYLCIGDVSGKGVPASLIMAVARAMFRVVARQGLPPVEMARRINDTLSEKNEQMLFVTMFFASIDLVTGTMDYCNCGHNAPVIFGQGQSPAFLDCLPNTAVGILPGFAYEGQRVEDMHGSVLFLYTDGLNEAENAAHEQFGNDRMLSVIADVPFLDSRTLIKRLDAAVASHVADAEPSDDLTMLCLQISR